ncbi:acetyl-CoA hydrolase/transferase family protein [Cerasicoccus maritimus]|uniref:acetyl-CoA hydrolase/transferase family protein n=1 Tax=Cerasicoccus maritimus TaxID=490089 RepID=UPI0028525837|nr:acetyl-CoA hydrolase/transferase C-terminal domain-containing protein [Cerasicoccus maritimus]
MSDEIYQSKLTTTEAAIATIADQTNIVVGMAAGAPEKLLQSLADALLADKLPAVKIYYKLAMQSMANTLLKPEVVKKTTLNTFFMTGVERKLRSDGINADKKHLNYITYNFSELPDLLVNDIGVDTMIVTVSSMDQHGYFSFGTNNDFTTVAARSAKNLIVEVNPTMPRVFGDSMIHVSEVDMVVENNDTPIPMLPPGGQPTDEQVKIAEQVAKLINNGDTIQLGIGGISDAICDGLANHKDLGIHTELLSPGMAKLMQQDVVTNKRKNIHPRKTLYTLALGDQAFIDFINDNPAIESYPSSYINCPAVIAQNDNLVSINSAVQVDLYGNVNAEFLAGHEFSGTGGHADFVRGARMSKGGRTIIVMPSATKGISKIVLNVDQVTTSRMDAEYFVTEYGCVNVLGLNNEERAKALISIAHPDHREELTKAAKDIQLIVE